MHTHAHTQADYLSCNSQTCSHTDHKNKRKEKINANIIGRVLLDFKQGKYTLTRMGFNVSYVSWKMQNIYFGKEHEMD